MAQLTRVYQALSAQFQTLDKNSKESITLLYQNQEEIKQGLSASEFNLRAHQKAINAMGLEIDRLRTFMLALLPESPTKEDLNIPVLEMADVTLPPEEEGQEPQVVRRVNWPYYHQQVEKDLEILAELEKQRIEEERAAAEAEAAKKVEEEAAEQSSADEAEMVMGVEEGDEELPPELAGDDEANEEADEPPQDDEDDGIPEGAVVFGGS